MDTKQLTSIIKQMEKSRSIIASERDKLRDIIDEIDELLEPVTTGHEELEHSMQILRQAIDSLSEQA
jgi:hypothetical protein